MKPLRLVTGTIIIATILACSGVDCGRKAAKIVPALEKVNPEYATEPVECDEPYPTPSVVGCSMASLTCGGEVEGNTGAGGYKFGDSEYQKWFCTPQRNNYGESPEAVYTLEVPADIMADVYLTSDCEDLDIVAVGWNDTSRCPKVGHSIRECEMDTSTGGGMVRMTTVNKPQTYLLVVDGKQGVQANFRLRVECSTYR